ncbi:MAG: menaquinone reductase molybdopterin-binding-like subunit QrcB [Desulfovibrio sp.]|uniref:menaquinone reductase molybdopterin-binding-like subunit QrcB n=1 Tax=Desulfovibrio sp. 7SRBS1 TaxID=3378064 RepID=UPI003B41031D
MGVNRRSFIAFGAGATLGLLGTPVIWKTLDDVSIWSQNWSWIPRLKYGALEKKPAISKTYAAGSPIHVLTVNGNPVEALGNPDNPLSAGAINALAAPEVQMLYSPARIQQPMKKNGDKFEPIDWDSALGLLAGKIKGAGRKVAAISGDETGTANEVFSGFLSGLGSKDFFIMPSEHHLAAKSWHSLMNGKGHVGFDLENSDAVLIIGPDLFDSWGPVGRNGRAFAANRPAGEEAKAMYCYAGPVQNRTAAVADLWIPVAPGNEAAFALGVAYYLLEMGATADVDGFDAFRSLVLADYTPAKVTEAIGVSAKTLKNVAKALASAKSPVIVCGSPISQGGSPAGFVAGMALNILLGRINKPGGVRALPELPTVVPGAASRADIMAGDLVDYLLQVDGGKTPVPSVLLCYEANPRYALPQTDAMNKVLDKVSFVVSFSSFMDETAAKADLILPNPMCLERFESLETPYGSGVASFSLAQPVIDPLTDSRAATDILLAVAPKLGLDLGFETFEGVLMAKSEAVAGVGGFLSSQAAPAEAVAQGNAPALDGDLGDALAAGQAWVTIETVDQSKLSLAPMVLSKAAKPAGTDALLLAPQYQLNIGSGSMATPGYNLLTIRDDELKGKDMFVAMCSETAAKTGVSQNMKVKVVGQRGEIEARVNIDETVMPGVVSAPLGLGHTAWDVFTEGKGANVSKIMTASPEPGTGAPVWTGSQVKIAKS